MCTDGLSICGTQDADLAIAKMLQDQEYELARLAGIYDMDGSG